MTDSPWAVPTTSSGVCRDEARLVRRKHNHLIAGLGAIDFPSVFAAMKRLGYSHEISLAIYPYTDRLEEASRESLAHLLPMLQATGLAF